MKPNVYFLSSEKFNSNINVGLEKLFIKAGFQSCINTNDLTAIKIHFGEDGVETYLPSYMVQPVINSIKHCAGKPFLTDTCVLYKGKRDNAVDHLLLAEKHGYSIHKLGAPVLIGDGLVGNEDIEIEINGNIFKSVNIASIVFESNSIIVVSHVTGHMATGMGAAIKNIGMGFASRKGKLRQHSVMNPKISRKKCTGCGVCVDWCPENIITIEDGKAKIEYRKCIGCGECLAVCRFNAVKFDWKIQGEELQKRMAEHAFGVVKNKSGKIGYINYLIKMTKDCDCMATKQNPLIPDIGILASKDPVAIDKATLDIIRDRAGKDIAELSYPEINVTVQIEHAEKIGMGSSDYNLIEL